MIEYIKKTIDLIYYDEGYSEATNTTHGADGTSSSSLIYRIYDDSEDASMLFEEYCNEFLAIQEENEDLVRIEISDYRTCNTIIFHMSLKFRFFRLVKALNHSCQQRDNFGEFLIFHLKVKYEKL